jgi:hypothetical protein
MALDSDGTPYYYQIKTMQTQWERPTRIPSESLPDTDTSAPTGSNDQEISTTATTATNPTSNTLSSIEISQDQLAQAVERAKMALTAQEEEAERQRELKRAKKEKEREKREKERNKEKERKRMKDQEKGVKRMEDGSLSPRELNIEMKKELREELSAVVIKYFSRHKGSFPHEEFKKHARKVRSYKYFYLTTKFSLSHFC